MEAGCGNTGAGGADDALREFNKHCQSVHRRPGNLGGQAPKPPPDRRNDDVDTMWTTMERRRKMR